MENDYLKRFHWDAVPSDLIPFALKTLKEYQLKVQSHHLKSLSHDLFFKYAVKIIVISEFFAHTLTSYPFLIHELFENHQINHSMNSVDYQKVFNSLLNLSSLSEWMRHLRLLCKQHLCRIIWQDLIYSFDPWRLMEDWSNFAENAISSTLQWLESQYRLQHGMPFNAFSEEMKLCVVALGKLGGKELNWSSDIDLMFAYESEGEILHEEHKISHAQYFTRLTQDLIKILHQVTAEGFVFRVDLRLRPYGSAGALVLPIKAWQLYYQNNAKPWERYALLRGRILSGNSNAKVQIQRLIQDFVFSADVDYTLLEPLRELQAKIEKKYTKNSIEYDIKRGEGGIRQLEFMVQTQQLISASHSKLLCSPSLEKAMNILKRERILPEKEVEKWEKAYLFLRRTEHLLQSISDHQTHVIPRDSLSQLKVAFGLGFEKWENFLEILNDYRKIIISAYKKLIDKPVFEEISSSVWISNQTPHRTYLKTLGYEKVEGLETLLNHLERDLTLNQRQKEQLNRLIPVLIVTVSSKSSSPDAALKRILEVMKGVGSRPVFLSLLLENPKILRILVQLCDTGDWITQFLIQHPPLLAELIDSTWLSSPMGLSEFEKQLSHFSEWYAHETMEEKIEWLIYFKLSQVFKIAVRDITGNLPLMRVSDQLSDLATAILRVLCDLSIEEVAKNAIKRKTDLIRLKNAFAVIGYGKLGGLELGYGSDLDLVFIYDTVSIKPEKEFIPTVFYTDVARYLIHLLQMQTRSGKLYALDFRLRPEGKSGLLVNSISAFQDYQLQKAWVWEHQALVRARAIVASPAMEKLFKGIRERVLFQRRNLFDLKEAVSKMRKKMHSIQRGFGKETVHLKYSPGGITDIEFIVQYYALAYAWQFPDIVLYTDNIRILESLARHFILTKKEAEFLSEAYRLYRKTLHRLDLLQKEPLAPLSQFRSTLDQVRLIWERAFG